MKKTKSKTINIWLNEVAATTATPGGGSAAGLAAATAAGLIEMAASYTLGDKWADRAETMESAIRESSTLHRRALDAMDQDMAAFENIAKCYAMPESNQIEKAARAEALRQSLISAAKAPSQLALISHRLAKLCSDLALMANPVVLSEVAVAASFTRCALEASVINLQESMRLINDAAERKSIALVVATATSDIQIAHAVNNVIQERIQNP